MRLINENIPVEKTYIIELTESELHYIIASVGIMNFNKYNEEREDYYGLKHLDSETTNNVFNELLKISKVAIRY